MVRIKETHQLLNIVIIINPFYLKKNRKTFFQSSEETRRRDILNSTKLMKMNSSRVYLQNTNCRYLKMSCTLVCVTDNGPSFRVRRLLANYFHGQLATDV